MNGTRRRRWAAIVDGDNMVQGGRLDTAEGAEVLGRIDQITRGVPTTCAFESSLAKRHLGRLADLGWGLRFVPSGRDAADRELLRVAEEYVAAGITDLYVFSGDHAFAELAPHVRLHVVAPRRSLSARLRTAATSWTTLPLLTLAAA